MELWLVVEDADGVAHDVAVDADETHTVGDLLEAFGLNGARARLLRSDAPLEPRQILAASGLRAGDLITTRRRSTSPPANGGYRLVVAGGPSAGAVFPLPKGETVIGRSTRGGVSIADTALSRTHLAVTVDGSTITVSDAGSSHGTFMHGRRLEESTPLPEGTVVEAGSTALRVEAVRDDSPPASVKDGRLQFSRPPRLRQPDAAVVHTLAPPPEPMTKRRIPLSSSLLPLAAAPIMAMGGGGRSYLLIALLSPVVAVASVLEERRSGGKDRQEKLESFYEDLARTSDAMARGVEQEATQRWAASPDAAEVLRRAVAPSGRLWERRPGDPDFLALRVGWADQPSRATWSMREGGEASVREEAAKELDQYGVARAVPVVVDLTTAPVVGLAGEPAAVEETARWLVSQAAVLHSHRDLTLGVAVTSSRASAWAWTTWLPHARGDAVPFGAHPFAVGDDAARALIASLNDLVAARREQKQGRLDTAAAAAPAVLLVLDEDLQVPRSSVAALLEEGPGVGVRILWVGDRVDGLPGETRTIIDRQASDVTTTEVASGSVIGPAQPDRWSLEQATEVARALAGVRDATARGRGGGDLPSFVPLPDLLGGGEPNAEAIAATWSRHSGHLGAPIGICDNGLFVIDLRRDGPHALLGGTTGAGKSELLQTYVAALAATIPPTRLTFLLVDYKGGAAFKDCVQLPHVVGFVTDLDGHLVHRALVSLNAELHRRERLLASVGAKDLIEMERKAPEKAPAALLLVVDEFATLAKELPEFVDGVVNVAQRGRSLGIHMLLATQRPAGAINDNIRANTNLRMALRMNDEADSEDVINSKLAAALPRSLPGRAFARTGASELTEVQIGYAGGHTLAGGDVQPLLVHPLRWGRIERPEKRRAVVDDGRPTDLQKVVEVVREARDQLDLPLQPAPWLPALPPLLPLAHVADPGGPSVATVGLLDLPARQAQQPFGFDLEAEGSLLVFGTSGSGKTTLLRTMALSLAQKNTPERLHLYALDFASRGLGALEQLPHCGAVVNGEDIERVQRMFTLLERWIAQRKQRFGEVGASTLEEHTRLAGEEAALPRAVVLLDSYGGFASLFEKIDYGARLESFPQLVSEGRPLGIHFVITADRRNAVPLALTSTVPSKVVLRLADADDYGVLGLDVRIAREAALPAGRGFQADTLEVQCALVGQDPAGDAQQDVLAEEGRRLREQWGDGNAPRIGTLPTEVELAPLLALAAPLRPAVGIGESELAPVHVDLSEGHFLVTGPNRSGKSTALAALACGLRAADPELTLHLLAPRRTPLTALEIWTSVSRGSEAIDEICTQVKEELDEREPGDPPVVLVLDDGHELADSMADSSLESIARRGRDVDVWVVGASEVAAAHRSYGGWLPEVRKERQGLLLQPDSDIDGDLLGVRLPKTRTSLPGRGALVTRSGVQAVQVGGG